MKLNYDVRRGSINSPQAKVEIPRKKNSNFAQSYLEERVWFKEEQRKADLKK